MRLRTWLAALVAVIISAVAALAPAAVANPSATPAPFPSVLHACGRHLCDSNGYQMPTLKSFNMHYQWPQSDFQAMYNQGARLARVNIAWSQLEPTAGHIDMSYVTGTVDPMIQRAVAVGMYVQPEILFNVQSAWPSWAGAKAMSNFILHGQLATQFVAERYGDPASPNYLSGLDSRAVVGFGIDEPPIDCGTCADKIPHLEGQERTFIGWFRADAPQWIAFIAEGYGGSTPYYNLACAAEAGKQMKGTPASVTAYDSVGGNVVYDLHDYFLGATTKTPSYDGRNFYGSNADVSAGGNQVKMDDYTPDVYPAPASGYQSRTSLLTQFKGYVCPIAKYAHDYDPAAAKPGMPLDIGEFGWRVGSSTTTLQAGSGYAGFIADKLNAWANPGFGNVAPAIEQEWNYSHNQATGDSYAAKPMINGVPQWQPITLDWLSAP